MFSDYFIAAGAEYSTLEQQVPAPCFRKKFVVSSRADHAWLTVCGLGFYEAFVNGIRVTRGRLSPYISNPDDLLYYDRYDVAAQLNEGENTLCFILGNGMLNAFGGEIWQFDQAAFRSAPKLALEFEVTKDGKRVLFFDAADGFRCAPSAIYSDDLRIGEWYDARRELPGWMKPGFDDSAWGVPVAASAPKGERRICDVDPILPICERHAINVRPGKISRFPELRPEITVIDPPEDEAGTEGFLYDFGINSAGVCRLSIRNTTPGQKIILQFGEVLDKDGGLDLRAMSFLPRRLDHRDIYICKGGKSETWEPMFTYHGFRYCLVLGCREDQATPELLTAVELYTAFRQRTYFHCSNDMVNRLWKAGVQSDRTNFHHFPTDCPQREKNGWTGDASLSAEHMMLCYGVERNLREWMRNVCHAMKEDGSLPGIVPTAGWGYGHGPAWDNVIVNVPYEVWRYSGQTEILEETAPYLERYLRFLAAQRDERGLLLRGHGDWCHAGRPSNEPKAPRDLTLSAIGLDTFRKSERIFSELGQEERRDTAKQLANEMLEAIRKHLIDHASATAHGNCQTSQAMALYYGVFLPEERSKAFEKLLEFIAQQDGHLDVGILGARVLFHVLSEFGRTDLALSMITRTDFPSYGYWIADGDTTLCESFLPPDSCPESHNHHFFGDILSWFVRNLAGIQLYPQGSPRSMVRIAPAFPDGMSDASAQTETPFGAVSVEWTQSGQTIDFTLSVPSGMTAEFLLPDGVCFEDGEAQKNLAAGKYSLSLKKSVR